jgi:glycosyltransferase involved in cell wall biosynthesis
MTGYYPRTLWDNSTRNFRLKSSTFTQLRRLTIVTPSDWLTNHVGNSFFQEYPRLTINNGIDLETFRPRSQKASDPLVLGVANAWPKSKGLDDFVRLRSILPPTFRIALIGVSRRQAKSLPRGIEAVLRTDSTVQLAEWYSKATVFVNPTYTDNFPTTNLEALACGTPVLTYNTGGSPEAISNTTGEVVPIGDLKRLSSTIVKWAEKSVPAVAEACRKRAEEMYSDKRKLAEYVDLYAKFLSTSITDR